MSRLIGLKGFACAEICHVEDEIKLVICDEQMRDLSLTLESARLLYNALRIFDSEGLLDDQRD